MRSLSLIRLFTTGLSFFSLHSNHNLLAQARSLTTCSQELQQTRQAIYKTSGPNQSSDSFSTYQKLQNAYNTWGECIQGIKAPLSSFRTLDGKAYDSTSLSGKIIVVNFWFVGCAPCRAEMPALNKLVNEYKGKDVLFFGFSTDKTDRLTPTFFSKNRFDFTIVADAQELARSFHVTGYPTTFIIDEQGLIRQAWFGYMDNSLDNLAPYYKAKAAIDYLLATAKK
ncbi:peroxiredoxin family protein [Spirosoma pomorum]